jgi:predicted site-specific integrase-resolvase
MAGMGQGLGDGEADDDLVRGMAEVLISFCARRYGRRSARSRALKAVGSVRRDAGPRVVLAGTVG